MKKILFSLITFLFLVNIVSVSAEITIIGATSEYVSGSFSHSTNNVGYFFVNKTNWENTWFSFTSDTVYYTLKIPLINVGSYNIPIYLKTAYKESCTIGNITTECYAEKTEHIDDFSIDITEVPQEMKEVPLPNNGLIPSMETVISSGGFQFSPQVGVASTIINTDNCKTTGISINYGDTDTIMCGTEDECEIEIKAEYPFTDTSGNNYVKMRMTTNCYVYTYSLSGTGGTGGITPSGSCDEIKITITGTATRGRQLRLTTTNQDGKKIPARIIVMDSNPDVEDQLFVTNDPWDGIKRIHISEASMAPITIDAENPDLGENCYGSEMITKIEGQLILPNETTEPEDLPKLEIRDMVEEVYKDSCFVGKVYADDSLVTNDDVSGDVVRIKKPEADEYTLKTKINDSDVFSVCVGSKMGEWTLKASYDGYEDSEEYTVTVREPREKVIVLAKLNYGTYYMPPEQLPNIPPGTSVLVILSDEENYTVEESIEIEVEFAGESIQMGLTGGFGMYTPPKGIIGEIIFRIPQSDNYEAWSSGPIMVVEGGGMDWVYEYVIYGAVAFIILILLILILRRRGGGGKIKESEPKEDEVSHGEMQFVED